MVAEAFKAFITSVFHFAASVPEADNAEKSNCRFVVSKAILLCQVAVPGRFTRVTTMVFPPFRTSAAVAEEVMVPVIFTALEVLIVNVEGTNVTVPEV